MNLFAFILIEHIADIVGRARTPPTADSARNDEIIFHLQNFLCKDNVYYVHIENTLTIHITHDIRRNMQATMGNSDLYELIVFDRLRARVSNLNDRERPNMRADEELPIIK